MARKKLWCVWLYAHPEPTKHGCYAVKAYNKHYKTKEPESWVEIEDLPDVTAKFTGRIVLHSPNYSALWDIIKKSRMVEARKGIEEGSKRTRDQNLVVHSLSVYPYKGERRANKHILLYNIEDMMSADFTYQPEISETYPTGDYWGDSPIRKKS